jgi:hypothetical protein
MKHQTISCSCGNQSPENCGLSHIAYDMQCVSGLRETEQSNKVSSKEGISGCRCTVEYMVVGLTSDPIQEASRHHGPPPARPNPNPSCGTCAPSFLSFFLPYHEVQSTLSQQVTVNSTLTADACNVNLAVHHERHGSCRLSSLVYKYVCTYIYALNPLQVSFCILQHQHRSIPPQREPTQAEVMTACEAVRPLNTEAVRKHFPGLQAGSVCLNNGSGALVFQGAIESIARTMSKPHLNLRGLDSKSKVDVEERRSNYARLASFMNASPDEIGK